MLSRPTPLTHDLLLMLARRASRQTSLGRRRLTSVVGAPGQGVSGARRGEIQWLHLRLTVLSGAKMYMSILCFAIYLASAGAQLRSEVVLAPLFSDHAVFQQKMPVAVWGRSDPGESIHVVFADQSHRTLADREGRWKLSLEPMDACPVPRRLVIQGKNTVVVNDILIGDVWLCSGQSNMAWSVGASESPEAEVAAGNWPLIREFKVGLTTAGDIQDDVAGSWSICNPRTVSSFSAVGYHFARELHSSLGVPVGIINCTFGGSAIEAWLSPKALNSRTKLSAVVAARWHQAIAEVTIEQREAHERELAEWKRKADAAVLTPAEMAPPRPWPPPGPGSFQAPASLYHGMLSPLVPYSIKGTLWYQGEANATRSSEYAELFAALIVSWREEFGQGDFPFLWVQLPNFRVRTDASGRNWARLREAQSTALRLPATGQAVSIDIGEPDSIHPLNKQEVGRRLALIAKATVYRIAVEHRGPRPDRVEREGAAIRIHFSDTGGELTADTPTLQSFELLGEDHRLHPAFAVIEGNTMLVRSPQVPTPTEVRYAWTNCPDARLYNRDGLPAAPFRIGL